MVSNLQGPLAVDRMVRGHAALFARLQEARALAQQVLHAHAGEDPKRLRAVEALVADLQEDLAVHLSEEEEALRRSAEPPHQQRDHAQLRSLVAELRERTSGYVAPRGACDTWVELWRKLAAMETALEQQIGDEELLPSQPLLAADLPALVRELRSSEAHRASGHSARTLLRTSDLRVVLVTLDAGRKLAEHRVDDAATVQALSGWLALRLRDRRLLLPTGTLAFLEAGAPHEVEALEDSAFLLTIGWQRPRAPAPR